MTADQWNERVPIGTPVTYWPIRKNNGEMLGDPVDTVTRTKAEERNGDVVVWLEAKAGFVRVCHLTPRVPS